MTGSGFPQRFADLDGSMIDVYQAMTQVTDEAEDTLPTTAQMHSLLDGALDNALGSKGYYGIFNAILHSDLGDHAQLNDMVSEALERGVPVVSSAQVLEWLDGRNGSSFAQHRLREQPAHVLARHQRQGARPRGDAARALRHAARCRSSRAAASRCRGASAPSRASTTSCSRAWRAATRRATRPTRRAPDISAGHRRAT